MKLIGIKQTDEYYLVLPIENNKVKLPLWLDQIDRVILVTNQDKITAIEEDLHGYINSGISMSRVESFVNNDRETIDYKYLVRGNYIHTSTSKGNLIVLYNAIPLDEKGEPLIPEEVNLIEAIVWFNVKEYLWNVTIMNPNQYSQLFKKAETEWSYYSIQAKTASIFPKTQDSMNTLLNKYLKILPNFNK